MSDERLPIEEAIRGWDRSSVAEKLAKAEEQRRRVVVTFPLEQWSTLPLERYALGTDRSSGGFCYAMEFGTPDIGSIRGGSSRKHLIYWRREQGEWWYYDQDTASVEEAWSAIRAAFVRAFQLADENDFDAIGDLEPIAGAPALVSKAVYAYFPDRIIPIFSHSHVIHFWEILGGQGEVPWSASGPRRLLELARRQPEFRDWAPHEIERFLYSWSNPLDKPRIVKIAPGPDANLWDDCRTNSYIRVGWEGVGDLDDYPSKEEFVARFAEQYGELYRGSKAKITEKANELWTLKELQPGDTVLANRGTSRIAGIGRVKDPVYQFRPELGEYGHTVAVDWYDTMERQIDPIKRCRRSPSWAKSKKPSAGRAKPSFLARLARARRTARAASACGGSQRSMVNLSLSVCWPIASALRASRGATRPHKPSAACGGSSRTLPFGVGTVFSMTRWWTTDTDGFSGTTRWCSPAIL